MVALVCTVFIVAIIALAIIVFFVQRKRTVDQAATKFKKESKEADIEMAQQPGIPTTKAEEPQESFDEVQPTSAGAI